jgi:TPR repeat protein
MLPIPQEQQNPATSSAFASPIPIKMSEVDGNPRRHLADPIQQNDGGGPGEQALSRPILTVEAHDFKLSADQGNADRQWLYGLCLQDGRGVPIDCASAAHYFKLLADQGNADGQCSYGLCLRDGRGVPIDFAGAAHYSQLSADQGNSGGQCCYGLCLRDGNGVRINFAGAAHYFKLSADQGNADGQYLYGLCL